MLFLKVTHLSIRTARLVVRCSAFVICWVAVKASLVAVLPCALFVDCVLDRYGESLPRCVAQWSNQHRFALAVLTCVGMTCAAALVHDLSGSAFDPYGIVVNDPSFEGVSGAIRLAFVSARLGWASIRCGTRAVAVCLLSFSR